MTDRQVTATGKNQHGAIVSLCNAGQPWSPRQKADAITDIRTRQHRYWVAWPGQPSTWIEVVEGLQGPYLRTDRDSTSRNNLDELPDC